MEGRWDTRQPLGMATRDIGLRLIHQLNYYSFLEPLDLRENTVPLGLVVAAE